MNDFSPNSQYTGAWGEISLRIGARDTVLLAFIAGCVLIISSAYGYPHLAFTGSLIGYLALFVTLLTKHHDTIIGQLCQYQNHVAVFHGINGKNVFFPEWTSKLYVENALKQRTSFRDGAQFFIIISLCFIGVFPLVYQIIYFTNIYYIVIFTILIAGNFIFMLYSCILIRYTAFIRKRLLENHFNPGEGELVRHFIEEGRMNTQGIKLSKYLTPKFLKERKIRIEEE